MKKKAIAEIPYMKAKRATKKYAFVAMEQILEIKGEEHLLVEIFENTREGRKQPKLRVALTHEDWGIYYVDEDVWSGARTRDEYNRNIWETSTKKRDHETFMNQESQDEIWEWCGDTYMSKEYNSWTDRIIHLEDDIKHKRWKKRDNNRWKRLEERGKNTPELPQDLEAWADKNLFRGMSFLYYKRNGRYADVCCSECGQKTTVATQRRDSFEGQFEKIIETPKNRNRGKCPMCGAWGQWKPQGKTKGTWGMKRYFYVGQPYKETGAVIRYIQAEKMIRREENLEDSRVEMTGAQKSISIIEISRQYLKKGEKPHRDFQKYSGYSNKCFWDDCNESYGGVRIKPGTIYQKTFEMLKGTELQYAAADEFQKTYAEFNLMDYMQRYMEFPQIEMLTKMGLTGVVLKMVDGNCGIIKDQYARKPEDFLGIRKERMKSFMEKQGETKYLEALQKEKQMGQRWSDRELEFVMESNASQADMRAVLEYMTMTQLVNRIEKYSGVQITGQTDAPMCGKAASLMKTATNTYLDYLGMRVQRGYDLHNTVFLFPRNLQTAHDLMVEEVNKDEYEKKDLEVTKKYPNIKKQYRSLRNRYCYEDEEFLIRPARTAAEIVREGRILHHCVGGDGYLSNHDKGEAIILFLRSKRMPETPYITVEIRGTTIRQWYGAYDKKPDKENMEKWLGQYTEALKEERQQAANIA